MRSPSLPKKYIAIHLALCLCHSLPLFLVFRRFFHPTKKSHRHLTLPPVHRTPVLGIVQFWDLEKVRLNARHICLVRTHESVCVHMNVTVLVALCVHVSCESHSLLQCTHADPRCVACCVAVSTAVALLLQNKTCASLSLFLCLSMSPLITHVCNVLINDTATADCIELIDQACTIGGNGICCLSSNFCLSFLQFFLSLIFLLIFFHIPHCKSELGNDPALLVEWAKWAGVTNENLIRILDSSNRQSALYSLSLSLFVAFYRESSLCPFGCTETSHSSAVKQWRSASRHSVPRATLPTASRTSFTSVRTVILRSPFSPPLSVHRCVSASVSDVHRAPVWRVRCSAAASAAVR